jgi:hypothetical protein
MNCFDSVQVKAGHQVAYLKAWLQDIHGLKATSVKLLYNGKEMIDPLSLCDYPDVDASKRCDIVVEER